MKRTREGWQGSKWIRPEKRLAIYLRDEFRCLYCGLDLVELPARKRTLDHVIPVSRGGNNEAGNLVTSCTTCNERKCDRTAAEFIFADVQPECANTRAANIFRTIVMQTVRPINVKLAKAVLNGTLDLSDVLQERAQ